MAPPPKAKVLASLTDALPLLEKGKAHFVRCHQKGQKDMALIPYRNLQPVLHAVIQDFGALVALRYELLERMLAEAKMKMKSAVLNLDKATGRTAKRTPKRASAPKRTKKTAKSKKKRTAKASSAAKPKAKKTRRTTKAKKRTAKKTGKARR